jgi:chromosome segregation protein
VLLERRRAANAARADAEARLEQAREALRAAESRREDAAAERDSAQTDAASARAALAALDSEATALRRALPGATDDRAIDHIKAAPGFERALAAALGDDLDAGFATGASRRWAGTAAHPADPSLPPACTPLAARVEAPPALARRLSQIGVVDRDDGSILLAPGQRLVTRDGKLRRWDGFVATGLGAAAAERLIRANRLSELETLLPPAKAALADADARIAAAAAALQSARDAAEAARRAQNMAEAAIRDAVRVEDQVEAELERLQIRRAGLDERADQAARDVEEARARHAEAAATLTALPDPAATRQRVAEAAAASEKQQRALAEVRAEAATHARALSSDSQRRTAAAAELAAWTARSTKAIERDDELARRIAEAEEEAAISPALPSVSNGTLPARGRGRHRPAIVPRNRRSRAHRRRPPRAADALLARAVEALAAARETRAGAAARAENQDSRRVEMSRISGERFECPPPLLPQRLHFDEAEIGIAQSESARLEKLTMDRERIGPVNLIAERELAELEETRTTSAAEREELGTACHRLRGSIGSLNREGRARLLTAFEAVDRHFRSLFTTLFEGGQAHLSWSNPTIRSKPASRSWPSLPASASSRSPCCPAASRRSPPSR